MLSPHYRDDRVALYAGDVLDILTELPDSSMDAVVTDPPYNLTSKDAGGFMGHHWDSYDHHDGGFTGWCQAWSGECLRLLKPGGHLIAFGGTRTWHHLATGIERAGFEIRDSLAWMYSSGFPKSLDVSKAIDRTLGDNLARRHEFTAWMRATGLTSSQINEITGTMMGSHYLTKASQPAIATAEHLDLLRPHLPEIPERIEQLVAERTGIEHSDLARRQGTGSSRVMVDTRYARAGFAGSLYGGNGARRVVEQTAAHSPQAQQWQGWGTTLKPAFEPIVLARKPFPGTVARNTLEHAVGGMNIDATRLEGGRWPTNVFLDEDAAAELDQHSNHASRFFYVSKAPASQRPIVDGVAHATVKPLDLMQELVRLVTPPGGRVLEPFAGSGTTVEACLREGFCVTAIERESDYLPLIQTRIDREYAREATS